MAMARAFTINFPYNDREYTAVITQAKGSISIYIPHEELHSVLPEGRLSFNPQEGLHFDAAQLKPAQNLITTVLGALEHRRREVLD